MTTNRIILFMKPICKLLLLLALSFPIQLQASQSSAETAMQQFEHKRKRPASTPEGAPFEGFQKEIKAYLCREAKLTQAECDAFFPLFFEMKSKLRNLQRQEDRTLASSNSQSFTEADFDRVLNEVAQIRKKRLNIEYQYQKRFRKILSAEKLTRIISAERKFGRERFHHMFNQRQRK